MCGGHVVVTFHRVPPPPPPPPSRGSHQRDRSARSDEAALCLHTEFNHSSPHLHRAPARDPGLLRITEFMAAEVEKRFGEKRGVGGREGGHMNGGKLSEEEMAF